MKPFILVAATAVLALPFVSFAQTYDYVALDGTIKSVVAPTAANALAQIQAQGDAMHSGVRAADGILAPGDQVGLTYTYVSTSGSLKSVTASSVDAAFMLAADRAPASGFLVGH